MSSKNFRIKLIGIYGRISRACLDWSAVHSQDKMQKVDVCTFSLICNTLKLLISPLMGIDSLAKLCESVICQGL